MHEFKESDNFKSNHKLMSLSDIYSFFKPDSHTVTWGNDIEVCVSWQFSDGYMRWYLDDGIIKFEYVKTD